MVKITAKMLLERGSPKTGKLEQIRALNLSRLGLCSKDLPVSLLSRLHNLEQLDLSGNHLKELPPGLHLPSLHELNCSNNDMENVTSLQPLFALEKLQLEGNMYLTVSDNHKLMFLLSKLRLLNGKDVSSLAKHLRHVDNENLKKRVAGLWEAKFCKTLLVNSSAEKLKSLEGEFVKVAQAQIKYGPSSLNDYTKWRVEMLAKEHMRSLTESIKEEQGTAVDVKETNGMPSTPKRKRKTKRAMQDGGGAPESVQTADAAPAEASPWKLRRLQGTPTKEDEPSKSPRKGNRELSSPSSKRLKLESSRVRDHLCKVTPLKERKEDRLHVKEVDSTAKGPVSLLPQHVLQCHSKQDSPDDFSTQLWACAFEPPLDSCNSSQVSRIVATCGGESVCLIDCETGHVLKKYKVPGEEFFSLSWSCLMMSRDRGVARPCSILAAGGKRGMVKLIHPRASIAYGEFRASRRALSTIRFSPRQQSILFTGAYDNKIVMWDIGGIDSKYNFKVSQLLVLETTSTPLQLSLPPSGPDSNLLAGCETGLLHFNIQLSQNVLERAPTMEITFPIYEKEDKDTDYHTVDGLGFLTDDIVASKCRMAGCIYLWSWSRTQTSRPNKNKEVSAVILAVLQWSLTDVRYLSLSTCPSEGYVVCGDDIGKLWTYHLSDVLMTDRTIPPTEILPWPSPVRNGVGPMDGPSINSVAMDPKFRYLVSLSDKNMVVVWKRL